jgi:hypothetical protein
MTDLDRVEKAELLDMLEELANELAAWVEDHYARTQDKYPSEKRRYDRDMEPVLRARALLAARES